MGGILGWLVESIPGILAGLGIAFGWDKLAPTTAPAATKSMFPFLDSTGKVQWLRLGFFALLIGIGFMVFRFVNRKLKIFKTKR